MFSVFVPWLDISCQEKDRLEKAEDVSRYSTDNIKHCKLLKPLLSYQLTFLVNAWKVQASYLKTLLRSGGLQALKAIQNITVFWDSALLRGPIYILGGD